MLGGGAGVLVALVLARVAGERLLHRRRGLARRGAHLRQVSPRRPSPGLRWRLPYPIQSHEIVNLAQVRTLEVGYRNIVKTKVLKESLMLTDDENIVDLQFAVQYMVTRRRRTSCSTTASRRHRDAGGRDRDARDRRQEQDGLHPVRRARGRSPTSAQKLMQQILDRYKTGIAMSRVTIQNAQPPEQVQAAFDDAVKAGQDRERQKNEGQAYANDVIPKARGTASRLMEEAEGYKQRVIANAEGEASRFRQVLAEYTKAPAVTRERIYIETMQQILSSTSQDHRRHQGRAATCSTCRSTS